MSQPVDDITPQNSDEFLEQDTDLLGLTTQLLIALITTVACLVGFEILRRTKGSIYHPRPKFMKSSRIQTPSKRFFGWILPLLKRNDEKLHEYIGVDATFWIVMQRYCGWYFVFAGALNCLVVIPTNYHGELGLSGLNQLSMSNIGPSDPKLWVHLVSLYLIVIAGFTLILAIHQLYMRLREKYLTSMIAITENNHVSRTIFVDHLPKKLASDKTLREFFEWLDIGKIESVQINRRVDPLVRKIAERTECLKYLESAYVAFLKTIRQKDGRLLPRDEGESYGVFAFIKHLHDNPSDVALIPLQDLPKETSGAKTMNALDLYTTKLELLTYKINQSRASSRDTFEPGTTGFVTFTDPASALVASQVVLSRDPFQLRCQLAPEPQDVIWDNLNYTYKWRQFRRFFVLLASIALIIFWAIPFTFITSLISLKELTRVFPNIEDVIGRSTFVRSLITDVLPTFLTSFLMGLLPSILYAFTQFEKPERISNLEARTLNKYFFFLVVNVFLFVTLGSAFLTSIGLILQEPAAAFTILGVSLPAASNFFINYVILNLSSPALDLLQLPKLIFDIFLKKVMSTTPRARADFYKPSLPSYYVTIPTYISLFTITLCYTIISPIINIFACVMFAFSYLVSKYQAIYVHVPEYEGGASMWWYLMDHFFTSFWLLEITMVGVFLLKRAIIQTVIVVPLVYATYRLRSYCKMTVRKSARFLSLEQLNEILSSNTVREMSAVSPHSSENRSTGEDSVEDEEDVKRFYFNQPKHHQFIHPALVQPLSELWLPREMAAWKSVRFDWSEARGVSASTGNVRADVSQENLV